MRPLTTEHRETLDQDLKVEGVSYPPALVDAALSDDPERQLDATIKFRVFLTKDRHTPIERVVAYNLAPRFVEFLRASNSALQLEAAWALTNIAASIPGYTQAIVNANGVPALVNLLVSPFCDVREQAAWALGSIAGDSVPSRDCVLQHGVLCPLLALLDDRHEPSMIRTVTFALRNLCGDTDAQPAWQSISPVLPALARLIYASDDVVLADACWALAYLSNIDDTLQDILDAGVCLRLVDLLVHPSAEVRAPTLRVICNLSTGDDLQTQVAVACGVVPALAALLASPDSSERFDACWALANIAGGNYGQARAIFYAPVIPMLAGLLHDADTWTREEARRALLNAMSHDPLYQFPVDDLVARECVKTLCDQLQAVHSEDIQLSLIGLRNILNAGSRKREATSAVNQYACYLEEAGGVNTIRKLQSHDNLEICEAATIIIDYYFLGGMTGSTV